MTAFAFRATRVDVDDGAESPGLSFEIETDGDPLVHASFLAEGSTGREIRLWWASGNEGGDECVVAIESASLERDRLRVLFGQPRDSGVDPYDGLDIGFAPLEDADARAAATALSKMLHALGDRLRIDLDVPAPVIAGPHSHALRTRPGIPLLGLSASGAWRVPSGGEDAVVHLVLSNSGGPLAAGITVELGGAALETGLISARTIRAGSHHATFVQDGAVVRASIPSLDLAADVDVDRLGTAESPPKPSSDLAITVDAHRAGSAILTVRIRPLSGERASAAMLGRPITAV
jgi:hypothetical protein